jgi:FtsH-binding integral membrane protein
MKSFIGITYLHLLGGLGVTALSAKNPISSNPYIHILNVIILLIIVWFIESMKPGPFKYFVAFVFVTIIGQIIASSVKNLEDKKILDDVLIIVAGIFSAMTALGFYDNQNILGFGPYLFAGLIGLIIARIILIFMSLGNTSEKVVSTTDIVLSWVGTVIFSIYVAYDTQRIKEDARLKEKDYVNSSIGLLLDVVNLFQNVGDLMD